MTPESQRIAIAEVWREIKNYYHLTDSTGQAFVQAAIEKAMKEKQKECDDVMDAHERKLNEQLSRAAHASEPPDCVFCGRPPHPDSHGHSYRPKEPAHTSEQGADTKRLAIQLDWILQHAAELLPQTRKNLSSIRDDLAAMSQRTTKEK